MENKTLKEVEEEWKKSLDKDSIQKRKRIISNHLPQLNLFCRQELNDFKPFPGKRVDIEKKVPKSILKKAVVFNVKEAEREQERDAKGEDQITPDVQRRLNQ